MLKLALSDIDPVSGGIRVVPTILRQQSCIYLTPCTPLDWAQSSMDIPRDFQVSACISHVVQKTGQLFYLWRDRGRHEPGTPH